MSVLSMIERLTTRRITKWGSNSDQDFSNREVSHAAEYPEANVVTSLLKPPPFVTFDSGKYRHLVLLDIDHEAYLIPSTTPGHNHLYINHPLSDEDYYKVLDVLAEVGIIELGYAEASKKKGYTALRLPWVRKRNENEDDDSLQFSKVGYGDTAIAAPDSLVPF